MAVSVLSLQCGTCRRIHTVYGESMGKTQAFIGKAVKRKVCWGKLIRVPLIVIGV